MQRLGWHDSSTRIRGVKKRVFVRGDSQPRHAEHIELVEHVDLSTKRIEREWVPSSEKHGRAVRF